MSRNDTIQRGDVPTFTGRLYADENLEKGGIFGSWVRRPEVDALLDELLALRRELHTLKGTPASVDASFETVRSEGVSPAFAKAERALNLARQEFLARRENNPLQSQGEAAGFGAGWDARVRFDRELSSSRTTQRLVARLRIPPGVRGQAPFKLELYEPSPPPGVYELYSDVT